MLSMIVTSQWFSSEFVKKKEPGLDQSAVRSAIEKQEFKSVWLAIGSSQAW